MPNPFWIRAVVWLAVACAVVTTLARGLAVDTTTLGIVGGEVSLVVILLGTFDRILWRVPPFRSLPWPGRPPLLRGTWRMKLHVIESTPEAEDNDAPCYHVIRQTSSQVKVRILFADGHSRSVNAFLDLQEDESSLWFFYEYRAADGKPYRFGAAKHSISSKSLGDGVYWNHLGGRGTMAKEAHTSQLFDEFAKAREALGPALDHVDTSDRQDAGEARQRLADAQGR